MVKAAGVQEYLKPKIIFKDKLAGKVEKGVTVVSIGAGKGHELDEMDSLLPGSKIIGVDPHDYYSGPVKKRLETLAHDASYLPPEANAENLIGVADKSCDGVTLFFVLHHIDTRNYDQVMKEVRRVLKDDGFLFIAEDLVGSPQEQKTTERMDRILNVEPVNNGQHNYKNETEWKEFFWKHGFEVVKSHEEKPDKVRHGFMVLKRNKDYKEQDQK